MLLDGWRRAYAAGAAWRGIGHLTTYGPTDNSTFVTTFSPFPNRQTDTNKSRTRTTYIAIAVPPRVIPTILLLLSLLLISLREQRIAIKMGLLVGQKR